MGRYKRGCINELLFSEQNFELVLILAVKLDLHFLA